MPNFIDRNYDSPLDLAPPAGRRWPVLWPSAGSASSVGWSGTFKDERLRRIFSFQSMYAGLSPSRRSPLLASSPTWTRWPACASRSAACTPCPVALAAAARRQAPSSATASRSTHRSTRRPRRGRRRRPGRRLALAPTPSFATPTCPWPTGTLLGVRRRSRPDRPLLALVRRLAGGGAGWLPVGVAHHNIHFGEEWAGSVRRADRRGRPHARSVAAGVVPTCRDPTLAPPDRLVLYVLEPVPNLGGQVDWAIERDRVPTTSSPRLASRARLPDRRRGRAAGRPARLGARRAWSGARRSRWPTGSSRPDRSGRTTSIAGPPGWCSWVRTTLPASGSRWCSCRAGSPPSGWMLWPSPGRRRPRIGPRSTWYR